MTPYARGKRIVLPSSEPDQEPNGGPLSGLMLLGFQRGKRCGLWAAARRARRMARQTAAKMPLASARTLTASVAIGARVDAYIWLARWCERRAREIGRKG